jgi:sugar lactone lactonase YvrE
VADAGRNVTSLFWSGRARLGEGPLWDSRIDTLYWVDIVAGTVFAQAAAVEQDRPVREVTDRLADGPQRALDSVTSALPEWS